MLRSFVKSNVSRQVIIALAQHSTRSTTTTSTWSSSGCVPVKWTARLFHTGQPRLGAADQTSSPSLDDYKASLNFPPATHSVDTISENDVGKAVVLHGYLGARLDMSKKLSFVPLLDKHLKDSVQIVSFWKSGDGSESSSHSTLKSLAQNSAVALKGTVQRKEKAEGAPPMSRSGRRQDLEVTLDELVVLNKFPSDIRFSDSNMPPEQRHLQLRQSQELRDALQFRSRLSRACHEFFADERGFSEVETPLLFKSTPEGAREFLVPTRSKGEMYALPQSPQQFKQILMASGIPKYYQLARCFRDEDLRADRQPEFTQVDFEMAFATGSDVMEVVEDLIRAIWRRLLHTDLPDLPFERLSYQHAISKYGSDKPDPRLGMEIMRIDHMIPVDLVSKIGPLTYPIVEAFKFSISEDSSETRNFVMNFMDSTEAMPFNRNPEGQPGIFIYDPRKPLGGLQPFGFEAAEQMEEVLGLDVGDLLVIQARENVPFRGGSTPIGDLRLALHRAAAAEGLVEPPSGWHFLWVNEFPLFCPDDSQELGEESSKRIKSTHHPFTAPASAEDADLLINNPTEAFADHYDLVLNGVELGGGSRRIHQADVQEFVLREVLKMDEQTLEGFAPLIEVLRAGCPPHAGFALGFDRLCAVMLGKESIRDVIAFPKSGKGEDRLVKSPSKVSAEQLKTYHLQLKE